ncbi:Rv3235 family protein [Mycolicibacterium novocastrense]|uniref:Rv3235 family protein n=1 Tax=Mycolicibacterium novocastrense TaxID=59813 RepID=UPI000A61E948|nr:Rv3235 family protein [Mycolicibacterium novocastrense]
MAPVIDCEPPPLGAVACPPPSPKALRRRTSGRPGTGPGKRHPQRPVPIPAEPAPPRAAVVFADAALRRVLEVIDRRRPVAQLRPLLAPGPIETVLAMTRHPQSTVATLRRVRVRVTDDEGPAAEVFGTYSRGQRIRAIAARIAFDGRRWRVVALQIG